jgi:SAM-dependent methyltransferase
MRDEYTLTNSRVIDIWVKNGWEWGRPINKQQFQDAKNGKWEVLLTPTKPVPHEWFGELRGKKVLGLASGGGQQIPVFSALGSDCVVLDYSDEQLKNEKIVAEREGYTVELVKADMTKPLPFQDSRFDLVFHPVSNCYIEDVIPVWRECYRILKVGGILLSGLDNGINYVFDEDEGKAVNALPFNPLKDNLLYQKSLENNWGIQFSHTIEEQIGGQLQAGFTLTDIFHDTNGEGRLRELNIPTFYATRCIKK